MKEATGELNMTVITVIAIIAVATLFSTVLLPMIQGNIAQKTCDSYGEGYTAQKVSDSNTGTCAPAGDNAKWVCCKSTN